MDIFFCIYYPNVFDGFIDNIKFVILIIKICNKEKENIYIYKHSQTKTFLHLPDVYRI